jgi:hypothetical protein
MEPTNLSKAAEEMQKPAGTGIPMAERSARPEALPPTSERAACGSPSNV